MDHEGKRWRLAADAGLRLRFWDDECVLFHGAAGDTHRMPGLAGHLLQHLQRGAADRVGIADAIDLHEDDVASLLEELDRLGITEPAA